MDISAPRCLFWSIQSMYHLILCPARLYLNFQCLSMHSAPTVAHVPATLRSPWAPVFWHKDSPRTPPLLLDTDAIRCLVLSIQNMHHMRLCPARLYLDFQILSVGFSLTVACIPATLHLLPTPAFWHKDSPRTPPLILDSDTTRRLY